MKMIPGKMYYVDDCSESQAILDGWKRKFSHYDNGKMLFEHPEREDILIPWKYAVPVGEDQEMDGLKEGDEVYVSDDGNTYSVSKFYYVAPLKNGWHLCAGDTLNYENHPERLFSVSAWKYVKKVPKQTELTMAQIAEKFGVPVDQLRIKE